jgi:hypothetical protein
MTTDATEIAATNLVMFDAGEAHGKQIACHVGGYSPGNRVRLARAVRCGGCAARASGPLSEWGETSDNTDGV